MGFIACIHPTPCSIKCSTQFQFHLKELGLQIAMFNRSGGEEAEFQALPKCFKRILDKISLRLLPFSQRAARGVIGSHCICCGVDMGVDVVLEEEVGLRGGGGEGLCCGVGVLRIGVEAGVVVCVELGGEGLGMAGDITMTGGGGSIGVCCGKFFQHLSIPLHRGLCPRHRAMKCLTHPIGVLIRVGRGDIACGVVMNDICCGAWVVVVVLGHVES